MNEYTHNNLDERLRILKMVEEGRVTAGEGAKLLGALGHERNPVKIKERVSGSGPRWFRIRVTDLVTGKSKTTVNVPMSLVDWGLRVGGHFAPEIGDIDMQELSEMLQSGIDGKIIDVIDEEDSEHVEIYVD